MANKRLDTAKRNKKDEFYTTMDVISAEMKYYRNDFKNKIVFCNCDDPKKSNFFKYFVLNFQRLGLKKLITTHYNPDGSSYALKVTKRTIPQVLLMDTINIDKNAEIKLKGNGDFRSPECIKFLKQADIVVTNPPFSLFRAYMKQLIDYHKKFLVIGSANAFSYKEIFKYIKADKLWTGRSIHSGDRPFIVPKDYPMHASGEYINKKGQKILRIKGVRWFTNLKHAINHTPVITGIMYKPENYPKYVNYDAINVDRVANIPDDYNGNMGVPITFIDKYDPEQFKIIALGITGSIHFNSNRKMKVLKKSTGEWTGRYTHNAKGTLYYKYNPKTMKKKPAFEDCITGDKYISPYARIIIRRKKH